ncbi:FG-GAP repeat domain-containing protein [Sandaracinus amylolyticus]|uniref:FG-GAP repeat domain-containing protein n=1 Tax=Sandaracinus amylolyticus TaxID=927083 RepID=UPI001F267B3C|nr:VCBS repeat-containing protein [Sandaracinus amylolyticus]
MPSVRALPSLILAFVVAGCDCGGTPPDGRPCDRTNDCPSGFECIDGACFALGDGSIDALCDDGRARCGSSCCGVDRVCNAGVCALDCGDRVMCDRACCGAGEECVGSTQCAIECADEAQRCGASGELCCASGEACLGDACVALGEPCELTEECEIDAFCEPTLMRCVPRDAVDVCEFRPPVGEFSPRIACQWRPPAAYAAYQDVVMTPSVLNLTDDDGDGATDTRDIPDIVFAAFDRPTDGCCTTRARLVIASGACNADGSMTTHAMLDAPFIDNSGGIALGNLDPESDVANRAPEIVATFRLESPARNGVIAWRRASSDGSAWTEMWRRDGVPSTDQSSAGAQPSLADVSSDGQPDVVIGNLVLNGLTGATIWDGNVTVGTSSGVGNNAFLGPVSTIADIDLDGVMEVIAGNTVYDGRNGAEEWSYPYTTMGSPCGGGAVPCDGYNGVGNFDGDREGEVVIVRQGEVFVLNHDGSLLHRIAVPRLTCANNESGPPTIADFDGDGRPEIGTAGADYYAVVDLDCLATPMPAGCDSPGILWKVRNQDCSSRATGSSVFDFEGDGAAEVIYADEVSFRIFDGRTGAILYEDRTHRSNTRLEMPIVVDVDNDGKSEVVIPEPNPGTPNAGGIEIWEDVDNNWVRTRRVWNQHSYHVTNISEDGQVPRLEEPNWLSSRLNNFRQNVQPGGLFDAPDLQVASIVVGECISSGVLRIAITVTNRGALGVAPGIPVWVRATPAGGAEVDLGAHRTTTTLLPGRSETIVVTWDLGAPFGFESFTVRAKVDDDGTGAGVYNECIEDNNEITSEPLMTCSFG